MNPAIWGPPLWRIMTDVAYRTDRVQDPRIAPYALQWLKSLAFLLPCKYCRQSYRSYLTQLSPEPFLKQKHLVEWVWRIKEKVNDKLKKPPESRLALPLFLRRVNTATHCAHPDDVFDFLAILGLNFDPTDRLKKKYMMIFHTVLPLILAYPKLSKLMWKQPLKIGDLDSQQSYLDWLYELRQRYVRQEALPPLPPQQELWKRYLNAKASQREPLTCEYVLDDASTWSQEHSQMCRASQ